MNQQNGIGLLSDQDLRAIVNVRNEALIEQIQAQNEENREASQNDPTIIKCMQDQIIESLENPYQNHLYELKIPSEARLKEKNSSNLDLMYLNMQTNPEKYQSPSIFVEQNDLEWKIFNRHLKQQCFEIQLEYMIQHIELEKIDKKQDKKNQNRYKFQTNHTYFREFFKKTTDLYFFRIVDQMAQMNHETGSQYVSDQKSKIGEDLLSKISAKQLKDVQDKLSNTIVSSLTKIQEIKQQNNGYYIITDDILKMPKQLEYLPFTFPQVTMKEFEQGHFSLQQKIKQDKKREHSTTYPQVEKDNSNILKREMEGIHNMISSKDHNDITKTVSILNESYMHSTQNFYKLLRSEFDLSSPFNLIADPLEMVQKVHKVISNYASAKLMNDNFYAFSYNQTLLDMKTIPKNIRIKYIQLDSMNKCVPQDWFLGYDQFAIYTFLNLAGQRAEEAGYLKTYFRPPGKVPLNLLNNLEVLNVDYNKDFKGDLHQEGQSYYISYFLMRLQLLFETLFDLILMTSAIAIISYFAKKLIYLAFEESQRFQVTAQSMFEFLIALLFMRGLPITLDYNTYPYSVTLIVYTNLFNYNFAIYVLRYSKYFQKYYFYMALSTFLNYYYLKSYPYGSVTLTNIVYVTFVGYQLFHNLFKFSFQFELTILNLSRGNLSAILPARIQNTLQERHLVRQFGAQIQQDRQQRQLRDRNQQQRRIIEIQRLQQQEAARQAEAEQQFRVNRDRRLLELEQQLREQAMTMRQIGQLQANQTVPQSDEEIERDVESQIQSIRNLMNTNRYQEMLTQVSTLINRPQHVIDMITREQAFNSTNNIQDQHPPLYLEQFETYTNEVNRQILNITEILNQIITQNALLISQNNSNEDRSAERDSLPNQQRENQAPSPSIRSDGQIPRQQPQQLPQEESKQQRPRRTCVNRYHTSQSFSEQQPLPENNFSNLNSRDGQLSPEQLECQACGCDNCKRLLDASQRWQQDSSQRTTQFDSMSQADLELQDRMLWKQLSTIVELLGVQFILNRVSRNRKYENQYGRNSQLYTPRLKLIDDLNEICEVLNISKNEYVNQRFHLNGGITDEQAERRNQEILRKTTQSNYRGYTLDQIYRDHQRNIDRQREALQQSRPEAPIQPVVTPSPPIQQEDIYKNDHLPVIQAFIVNQTDQQSVDNKYVKDMIKYKKISPSPLDKETLRRYQQNPTYILTFKNPEDSIEQKICFVAGEIQNICRESIWRDPKQHNTDPVSEEQLNQYVNLKMKMEYKRDINDQVLIQRLFMKPIVQAKISQQQTLQNQRVPKYGKDKEVQSTIVYIKKSQNASNTSRNTQTTQNQVQQVQEEEKVSSVTNPVVDQPSRQQVSSSRQPFAQQNESHKPDASQEESNKEGMSPAEIKMLLQYLQNKIEATTEFDEPEVPEQSNTAQIEQQEDEEANYTINIGNIDQNLLLLQNQISQAAGALRFNPQNGTDNQPLTEERIKNAPRLHKEIEQFRKSFFNERIFDISWLDVMKLNKDERIFFKNMVTQFQDIIKLFPVLYSLQTHIMLMKLAEEKDKKRARRSNLVQSVASPQEQIRPRNQSSTNASTTASQDNILGNPSQ